MPHRWIRPSTAAFIREARRTTDYGLFDLLHGLVYGRWPYLYIGLGTGAHPLARLKGPAVRLYGLLRPGLARLAPPVRAEAPPRPNFADTYHGKVLPLAEARQLVRVEQSVDLGDLEQIIPYALARRLVLEEPEHIVAMACPCRAARPDPCLPLDVCLIVGEPFASFVMEHQPQRARWISQAEAEGILEAEHVRGHVHHAFFKDAMLGRFYAICNCCSCCCGALHAHQSGTPMLAASGYACVVDELLCAACGACLEACRFDALALHGDAVTVDFDRCMGCGACIDRCATGALRLEADRRKGIPLDLRALLAASRAATP